MNTSIFHDLHLLYLYDEELDIGSIVFDVLLVITSLKPYLNVGQFEFLLTDKSDHPLSLKMKFTLRLILYGTALGT